MATHTLIRPSVHQVELSSPDTRHGLRKLQFTCFGSPVSHWSLALISWRVAAFLSATNFTLRVTAAFRSSRSLYFTCTGSRLAGLSYLLSR